MTTKTVADKLLVKAGTTVWTSAPEHLDRIGPLPEGATAIGDLDAATTAVLFADDAASLRAVLAGNAASLKAPANLWVAYQKGNRTDINRDTVWPIVGEHGLRPIGQVALDDVWSALRFRPLKEGEAPFTGGRKPG
jgi:hypothetical protein